MKRKVTYIYLVLLIVVALIGCSGKKNGKKKTSQDEKETNNPIVEGELHDVINEAYTEKEITLPVKNSPNIVCVSHTSEGMEIFTKEWLDVPSAQYSRFVYIENEDRWEKTRLEFIDEFVEKINHANNEDDKYNSYLSNIKRGSDGNLYAIYTQEYETSLQLFAITKQQIVKIDLKAGKVEVVDLDIMLKRTEDNQVVGVDDDYYDIVNTEDGEYIGILDYFITESGGWFIIYENGTGILYNKDDNGEARKQTLYYNNQIVSEEAETDDGIPTVDEGVRLELWCGQYYDNQMFFIEGFNKNGLVDGLSIYDVGGGGKLGVLPYKSGSLGHYLLDGNMNGIYLAEQRVGIVRLKEGEEPKKLVAAADFPNLSNALIGFFVTENDEFYVYFEEWGDNKPKLFKYGFR